MKYDFYGDAHKKSNSSRYGAYRKQPNRPYKQAGSSMGIRKIYFALINAMYGFKIAIRDEMAIKMEIVVFLLALLVMCALGIEAFLKIVLCCCFCILLAVELLNSAVEMLCDFVKDGYDDAINPTARWRWSSPPPSGPAT